MNSLFVLEKPDSIVLSSYNKTIGPILAKRIMKNTILSSTIKNHLIPNWMQNPDLSVIEKILTSEPQELKSINDELSFFLFYYMDEIKKIFDYDYIISKNKDRAYWLSKMIDTKSCVYCNRIYTFTIEKIKYSNKSEKIVRPHFDHWFPKSKYPLLALSLYNLIPSCGNCNSSIKGDVELSLDEHLHPYVHNNQLPQISFKVDLKPSVQKNWTITIDCPPNSAEEKTIKAFRLQEIYDMHSDLEVKDIMDFLDAYSATYIKDLYSKLQTESPYINQHTVYRFLFGAEIDEDESLNRPFSKLKRDILKQFGIL